MRAEPRSPGLFVTLEGGEGAGKSTLAASLANSLRRHGHDVVVTREPGAGKLGAGIRSLLLDAHGIDVDPRAEALLFAADRAQHVTEVIRPALDAGSIVLCDRYIDSSVAYQGVARGLGADEVEGLSMWGTGGLMPDLTLLLDVDPRDGLARAAGRGAADRLEAEAVEFHDQVRAALRARAKADPLRFLLLNATEGADAVFQAAHLEIVVRRRRQLRLARHGLAG